jgi:hypothetical protein
MQKTIPFLLFLFLGALSISSSGQSVYMPSGHQHHDFIQRMEIKSGGSATEFHFHIQPLERKAMVDFLQRVDTSGNNLSYTDKKLIHLIRQSNGEWNSGKADSSRRTVLKHFYKIPSNFYQYHDDDLFLAINPVIHFEAGKENDRGGWLYQNTRGVEVRGMINKKVGFYSYIADNQARYPLYVNRKIVSQRGIVPGEGWNIPFGDQGFDYFTARGYIAFQATKNIGIQFGQDRGFLGYGQRSLLLSDYANNYLFAKINTKIWRFHYQNTFARLVDYPMQSHGGRRYDPKYMVNHVLSVNLSQSFQLGFFESVVFGRSDTLSHRSFDPHYLNPVIFYRAVEHHIGDPDKVALGVTWRWIAGRSLAFHGQVYLDDFLLSDVRNDLDSLWVRMGLRPERKYTDYASFRNKFGLQLGLNYLDVLGINNLDLAMEGNWVRPFTYTHYDTSGAGEQPAASYTHYGQPLAHPLGANFREWMIGLQYQPHHKWLIKTTLVSAQQGVDPAGINMGSNIFRDYTTRVGDYGHTFLQGDLKKTLFVQATASYQWRPGVWIDAKYILRNENLRDENLNARIFTIGFRINALERNHWF